MLTLVRLQAKSWGLASHMRLPGTEIGVRAMIVWLVRVKAILAPSIAASGSARERKAGRATAFGAALVVMLGMLTPSPVGAAILQPPATSGDLTTAELLHLTGAGAATPQIATGAGYACALLEDRTVRCWGNNGNRTLGDGTTTDRTRPVQVLVSGSTQGTDVLGGVTQIATGNFHACALLEDRTVRCWGSSGTLNQQGRLGDGTTTNSANPVQVLASGSTQGTDVLGGVTQIAVGGSHSCALLEDRTVRCWGSNGVAQLGNGTSFPTQQLNPVQVLASGSTQGTNVLGGVTQIAAGGNHACALLEDRTVRCWGGNDIGHLGDGTTTPDRANPVQVLASGSTQGEDVLGGVTQIAAGGAGSGGATGHTCALLVDGTVRCWGGNDIGQLGDGTTTPDRANPVQVLASGSTQGEDVLGGVTRIAPGVSHTCALLEDKTVRCWGRNAERQLGNGTSFPTQQLNPVQVLVSGSTQGTDVLGGVTQVAAGGSLACALLEDKSVRCWGDNARGALGDGTTDTRNNPVQVLESGTASSDPVVFLVGRDSFRSDSSSSGSVAASLLKVSCDGALQVGSLVTCSVTGGDPGIDILWRAAFNPVFAGQGVTLDADGSGTFAFTVPAAALGEEVTVELVEWLAPMSLGVAGGPVPTSVPSGGGPVPVWSLVLLVLAGGLVLRRMSAAGVRG
jgi:alpha-tubulin suppressor-like RCC1 family protein